MVTRRGKRIIISRSLCREWIGRADPRFWSQRLLSHKHRVTPISKSITQELRIRRVAGATRLIYITDTIRSGTRFPLNDSIRVAFGTNLSCSSRIWTGAPLPIRSAFPLRVRLRDVHALPEPTKSVANRTPGSRHEHTPRLTRRLYLCNSRIPITPRSWHTEDYVSFKTVSRRGIGSVARIDRPVADK